MQCSVVFIAVLIGLKLNIADVTACGNLAVNYKDVKQSSTYKNQAPAELAVDGIITSLFRHGQSGVLCTATEHDDLTPEWEVTLKETVLVKYIRITNRLDNNFSGRLRDLKIMAGVGSADSLCATFDGPADATTLQYTLVCKDPIVADTIKITKTVTNNNNHNEVLTLCEVEIFSHLPA